jgi:hypothetical protein
MKKIVLFSLMMIAGIVVLAQGLHLRPGIPTAKAVQSQQTAVEPAKSMVPLPVTPNSSNTKGTDVVNILTLGTAANAYTYGYAGGQKTIVWADDSLDAIINVHRMGPGTTPPGFSGYLSVDLGVNGAATIGDWTLNWQIYASTLNTGGTYFLDAARYPQGGIYAPPGTTSVNDAYAVYFAPNLSTNGNPTWGGYSYGRTKLGNQSDSTKHMRWYNPPPYTYISDGFEITQKGIVLETDIDQEWSGTTFVAYHENLILGRGVWNTGTNDFDYTFSTIPFPTTDAQRPLDDRVAASPDGNTVWIVSLSNNGGAVQVGDSGTYYPILFRSTNGGSNWDSPIAVQLDGPNGIPAIVYNFLSDYRIEQLYGQMVSREEIPYTTGFDCDIVVDKWGNPHIGVVVGVAAGNYAIAIGDSAFAVFDIYSTDKGATWNAVRMGQPWTFRGYYPDDTYTEDNRVNIASNEAGEFVFVTYQDTQIPGTTDNNYPDVFARGFNLLENKITSDAGVDQAENVTFLSDITQEAFFECTSHYVFSKPNGGHTIPIVTVGMTAPDPALPVTFKYVSDFSFDPGDYTIGVTNPPFPVGISEENEDILSVMVSPNPVSDMATLTINLKKSGNLSVIILNTLGQRVMSMEKGMVQAGSQQFTIDASRLPAGVYFCIVQINDKKITSRMIVK